VTTVVTALIEEFYRAYNAHDADAAAELYAEQGVHHDMATGARSVSRSEVRSSLRGFFGAFSTLEWTPTEILVGQVQHAVPYRMRLVSTRDGVARNAVITGVHTFDFAADRIVESRDYWDVADLQRQLTTS
jgi:limonene-1,2-epoxide hydrolase